MKSSSDPNLPESDRITLESWGIKRLLGIPFISFGLFMIFYFVIDPTANAKEKLGFFLLALLFLGFGIWLCIGVRGWIISRKKGTIQVGWGFFKIQSFQEKPIANFQHVSITHEKRGGKRREWFYVANLVGKADKMEFAVSKIFDEVRFLAEEMGKQLELGIRDSSSGSLIVREPCRLDECVRDRIIRRGERTAFPQTQAKGRITWSLDEKLREAGFSLPSIGFRTVFLFYVSVALLAGAGLFFPLRSVIIPFLPLGKLGLAKLVSLTLILIPTPFVIFCCFVLASTFESLLIDPEKITIHRKNFLWNRQTTFRWCDVEELYVSQGQQEGAGTPYLGGPRLVLRTDDKTDGIGVGLKDPELAWLCSAIKHLLVAFSDKSVS